MVMQRPSPEGALPVIRQVAAPARSPAIGSPRTPPPCNRLRMAMQRPSPEGALPVIRQPSLRRDPEPWFPPDPLPYYTYVNISELERPSPVGVLPVMRQPIARRNPEPWFPPDPLPLKNKILQDTRNPMQRPPP